MKHWLTTISLLKLWVIMRFTPRVRAQDTTRSKSFDLHRTSLSYFCLFLFQSHYSLPWSCLSVIGESDFICQTRETNDWHWHNLSFLEDLCYRASMTMIQQMYQMYSSWQEINIVLQSSLKFKNKVDAMFSEAMKNCQFTVYCLLFF
jgi:hypothetical protein